MASMVVSVAGNIFTARRAAWTDEQRFTACSSVSSLKRKDDRSGSSLMTVVRAAAEGINPQIRKAEEKVVDSVVVTELSKPVTAYCRCWRSGTFPLCDGGHMKHNKATGDNVGPLLLKK